MAANMADLLQILVDRGGSDLHITSGTYPQLRINGRLTQLTQFEQLTPQDTQRLAYSILNETQKQKFEEESELDLSFGIQGLARFRCNVFRQRGAVGSAIRLIPYKIRTFEDLSLPRSEEHTSELQSPCNLVCRLLLEKKKSYSSFASARADVNYKQ